MSAPNGCSCIPSRTLANTDVLQDSQKRDAKETQNSWRRKLENHYRKASKGSFSSRINWRYKAQNLSCMQTRVFSRYFYLLKMKI